MFACSACETDKTWSNGTEVWEWSPTGNQNRWLSLLAPYITQGCCEPWVAELTGAVHHAGVLQTMSGDGEEGEPSLLATYITQGCCEPWVETERKGSRAYWRRTSRRGAANHEWRRRGRGAELTGAVHHAGVLQTMSGDGEEGEPSLLATYITQGCCEPWVGTERKGSRAYWRRTSRRGAANHEWGRRGRGAELTGDVHHAGVLRTMSGDGEEGEPSLLATYITQVCCKPWVGTERKGSRAYWRRTSRRGAANHEWGRRGRGAELTGDVHHAGVLQTMSGDGEEGEPSLLATYITQGCCKPWVETERKGSRAYWWRTSRRGAANHEWRRKGREENREHDNIGCGYMSSIRNRPLCTVTNVGRWTNGVLCNSMIHVDGWRL